MDLDFVDAFCAELIEDGWERVSDVCGDVVLLFSMGDYFPSIGNCEDASITFCVKNREWALTELRRLKAL